MEKHFCTCSDTTCPFNPNNERCREKTCDACIKKCLKAHEIPSCFFKDIHPDISGNKDFSYAGFAEFLKNHPAGRK
ncbi:MAG: DUF6485 family protein [Candidatus Riflebacteria bacterium]|nr:DUF6485 family protein [Candidatus Riflebacteria bacterium]